MTPRVARQDGITLLELLLALAIGSLLMSALMPMLNLTIDAATDPASTDQAELDRQAAFAIERMNRVIRATKPAVLAPAPGATGLLAIINLPPQPAGTTGSWFSPSTFQFYRGTLIEMRDGDSVAHVLAESVQSAVFTALPVTDGTQLIQVDLVLKTGNATSTVSSVMRMGWMQ